MRKDTHLKFYNMIPVTRDCTWIMKITDSNSLHAAEMRFLRSVAWSNKKGSNKKLIDEKTYVIYTRKLMKININTVRRSRRKGSRDNTIYILIYRPLGRRN
jgi:hypothetical protein